MFNVEYVKDPRWNDADHRQICAIVKFSGFAEELPFTADPNDCTDYGPVIFADCAAGVYGPVGEYVAPAISAAANKAEAERRLKATDWVNQPDVYDTARDPHLTNRDAFLDYRSAVRAIAVNPVAGGIEWPVAPTAVWSV